ncbi:hypothetical protein GPECTOR_590phG16 [Gonium pectorale]|uniref:Pherophorin domain-containing protein n=1 Tax=Gonium pectorale TaxID=33097 RepID=A0A150FUI2_GONPE|nr:hypothetical protein GPECTOR_590phG16 [Gonium pectorale]|eukprot:KXZ41267.1 hypothetical protein GPECTOR_590phG16 [Gonium pectorale]
MRTTTLLVVLAVGLSHAIADDSSRTGAARRLSAVSGTATFPYHQCYKKGPEGSPCTFGSPTTRALNGTLTEFCFTVRCPGCNEANGCCSLLTKNIHKVYFNAEPGCKDALKSVFQPLSHNGRPLPSNVFVDDFTPAGVAIRWTRVGLSAAQFDGNTVCIRAPAPCNTVDKLFIQNANGYPMVALLDLPAAPSPSPPPSPPPPCTNLCLTWHRTNGASDAAACALLATSLTSIATGGAYGSYSLTAAGFKCSKADAGARNLTACGDFTTEASARAFGAMLQNQGFDALALAVKASSGLVPGPNGPVCDATFFEAVQFTGLTGARCDSWLKMLACSPIRPNEFPYCTCAPGVIRRTPYSLSLKRSFTRAGGKETHYCFAINVNATQCGSSRCCGMGLDKIEFLSDEDNCLGSALGFTVSTKPNDLKSPVWTRNVDSSFSPPQAFGVFKVNNLGLTIATAGSAEVCIVLRPGSACPTLDKFCHQGGSVGCQYALFDGSHDCCAEDFALNDGGFASRRRFMAL